MLAKTIWTIGHSTRSIHDFVELLKSFKIKKVIDVRRYPGSRKYPHFNTDSLSDYLLNNNIQYMHIEKLGGRRKALADSKNTEWRHPAFRGYADFIDTSEFKEGIKSLEEAGIEMHSAYMCSEALWWRCHRALISDYLTVHGWKVLHILDIGKYKEHTFTAPAKIINGQLSYEPL